MATPITWRNVRGGSDAGATRMMESGTKSVNDGFGIFNKLLKDTEQVRSDNRDTRIDNNTQAFMDRLQSVRDPDKMARLQASGELQEQLEGYGGMIDRDATRGAVDERLTGLREMQTTNREYAENEARYGNRDAMSNARAALAAGNLEEFDRISGNTDWTKPGEMAQLRADAARRIKDQNFADTKQDRLKAQWSRDDEELRIQNEGDEIISSLYGGATRDRNGALNTAETVTAELAQELGVPVATLQDPEFRANLTGDQRAAFEAAGQRIRQNTPERVAAGEMRDTAIERLTDAGWTYPDAVAQVNAADQKFAATDGLSAIGQQQVAKVKQEHADAMRQNSFYQAANSEESTADILRSVNEVASKRKDGRWNNWFEDNKQEVDDFVSKAVAGEFEIGGVKQRLPRALIESALLSMDAGLVTDDNPGDELEAILEKEGWKNELKAYNESLTNYQTRRDEITLRDSGRRGNRSSYNDLYNLPDSPEQSSRPAPSPSSSGASGSWQERSTAEAVDNLRNLSRTEQENKGVSTENNSSENVRRINALKDEIQNVSSSEESDKLRKSIVKLITDSGLVNGNAHLDVESFRNRDLVNRELKRRGLLEDGKKEAETNEKVRSGTGSGLSEDELNYEPSQSEVIKQANLSEQMSLNEQLLRRLFPERYKFDAT